MHKTGQAYGGKAVPFSKKAFGSVYLKYLANMRAWEEKNNVACATLLTKIGIAALLEFLFRFYFFLLLTFFYTLLWGLRGESRKSSQEIEEVL